MSGIIAFPIRALVCFFCFTCPLDSCNSIHELASILLSVDINQLSFPNERDTTIFLSDIFSDHSLFIATQKDLQATLDKLLFDDLYASLGSSLFECFVTPFWHK